MRQSSCLESEGASSSVSLWPAAGDEIKEPRESILGAMTGNSALYFRNSLSRSPYPLNFVEISPRDR